MHKAKACVVTCMDFRFQDKIQSYLEEKGLLGNCDEIIIAGASRDFVTPVEEDDGRYVWKQLGLSVKLHDPDQIIIIDHQDCGGYAQDGTIAGGQEKENDKNEHEKYLGTLKNKLEEKYPGKEIIMLYAPMEGDIEEI